MKHSGALKKQLLKPRPSRRKGGALWISSVLKIEGESNTFRFFIGKTE